MKKIKWEIVIASIRIHARYHEGILGYESAMIELSRLGFSEVEADDILHPNVCNTWDERASYV